MLKCPNCGDTSHLYSRADVRWNPETQAWEIGDMEEAIDCTECDESFYPSQVPEHDGRGDMLPQPKPHTNAIGRLVEAVRAIDMYDDGDPMLDEAGVRNLWTLADAIDEADMIEQVR